MLNWKKGIALALLILAMLITAACAEALPASAGTVGLVSPDRMIVEDFGMTMQTACTDGELKIVIDTEATDWSKALYEIMDPDLGTVTWRPYIQGVEGALCGQIPGTSEGEDEQILSMFEFEPWPSEEEIQDALRRSEEDENWKLQVSNGCEIGTYSVASGFFYPQSVESHYYGLRWFDADNEIICVEKMKLVIEFTSDEPVEVPLDLIPADQLVAGYGLDDETIKNVEITQKNGSVDYVLAKDYEPEDDEDNFRMETYVLCPDEDAAMDRNGNSAWSCVRSSWGDSWELDLCMITVDDQGTQRLAARVCEFDSLNVMDNPDGQGMSLTWIRNTEDGEEGASEIVQQGLLTVRAQGSLKIWAEYTDWSAVTGDQITITVSNGVDGMEPVFENGVVYARATPDEIPSGANLGTVEYTITVKPPKDADGVVRAVAYRENRSGGGNIFGRDDYGAMGQEERVFSKERMVISEKGDYQLLMRPCREQTYENLGLTVYLSNELLGEFSGSVNAIFWFDEDDELVARQWLAERYDAIERTEQTNAYESEEDIDGVLRLPVIVVEESGASGRYVLEITLRPVEGSSSVCYELQLKDKAGNNVELPGKCKLYLPYPPGHHPYGQLKYKIIHCDASYNEKEVFVEKVRKTKHGLCIEVSSLSPFVLNWQPSEGLDIENAMVLPAAIKTIGEQAFMDAAIEAVVIPAGCEAIESQAFANIAELEVYMPENAAFTIAKDAFDWNSVILIIPESSAEHILAQVPECEYYVIGNTEN